MLLLPPSVFLTIQKCWLFFLEFHPLWALLQLSISSMAHPIVLLSLLNFGSFVSYYWSLLDGVLPTNPWEGCSMCSHLISSTYLCYNSSLSIPQRFLSKILVKVTFVCTCSNLVSRLPTKIFLGDFVYTFQSSSSWFCYLSLTSDVNFLPYADDRILCYFWLTINEGGMSFPLCIPMPFSFQDYMQRFCSKIPIQGPTVFHMPLSPFLTCCLS